MRQIDNNIVFNLAVFSVPYWILQKQLSHYAGASCRLRIELDLLFTFNILLNSMEMHAQG